MKKFIAEILILLVCVMLPLIFVYHSDFTRHAKKMRSLEDGMNIVNFGTSHGGAFLYHDWELKGKRCHKGGNTLYYDLQNYKFLKPKLSEGAIVVLPVSYFLFGLDENRTDRGDDTFVNDFYYFLEKDQIFNYSSKKAGRLAIFQVQNNIKGLFESAYDAIFSEKKKTKPKTKATEKAMENLKIRQRRRTKVIVERPRSYKEKKAIEDSLLVINGKPPTPKEKSAKAKKKEDSMRRSLMSHAKDRTAHHKKLAAYSEQEKNVRYLSELIEDAQASGFKPVLVATPLYYHYNNRFDKLWLEKNYYKHMRAVSKKYKVPFLDYSHDGRFATDLELWKNSDHLNLEGQQAFTEAFFRDLLELKYVKREDKIFLD